MEFQRISKYECRINIKKIMKNKKNQIRRKIVDTKIPVLYANCFINYKLSLLEKLKRKEHIFIYLVSEHIEYISRPMYQNLKPALIPTF